jgi:hypothetical protein
MRRMWAKVKKTVKNIMIKKDKISAREPEFQSDTPPAPQNKVDDDVRLLKEKNRELERRISVVEQKLEDLQEQFSEEFGEDYAEDDDKKEEKE